MKRKDHNFSPEKSKDYCQQKIKYQISFRFFYFFLKCFYNWCHINSRYNREKSRALTHSNVVIKDVKENPFYVYIVVLSEW